MRCTYGMYAWDVIVSCKMHLKPNPQDNGVISKEFLRKLCRSDFKNYYSTPHLNDILYLHYKGFERIANLEEYHGLKVLYLEGNALKKIQALQLLTNLRCLYLQENLIGQISGLETLTLLSNLNLSDNMIQKVEGLSTLVRLSNLQLKRNRIGDKIEDVMGLLDCPSVSALDISDNRIADQSFVSEVLMKMPHVAVIYMHNNEFTKKIPHYRKSVISRIPQLKYIDDKPIFDDERRYADAWARGGLDEEREERLKYKAEQEQLQLKQHRDFRELLQRHSEEAKKEKAEKKAESSCDESSSKDESLETYKTPTESSLEQSDSSCKHSDTDSVKSTQEVAVERVQGYLDSLD